MTKVLVSPEFGAGWSTWNDKPKQVAEYKPIIEYIENGGDPSKLDEHHPLVRQMMSDLGLSDFYCGGANYLCVYKVDGPYRICEHDGFEHIETPEGFW